MGGGVVADEAGTDDGAVRVDDPLAGWANRTVVGLGVGDRPLRTAGAQDGGPAPNTREGSGPQAGLADLAVQGNDLHLPRPRELVKVDAWRALHREVAPPVHLRQRIESGQE